MAFPQTEQELIKAGYTLEGKTSCSICLTGIGWWKTPKGRLIPLHVDSLVLHWDVCKPISRPPEIPAWKVRWRGDGYGPR